MYGGRSRLSRRPGDRGSGLGGDHPYLPALVSRPVGEEPVVVALRAEGADRDFLYARLSCVFRDQGAEIHMARSCDWLSGELLPDIGTHLVAPAANGGAQVYCELVGREAISCQRRDCLRRDMRGGSPPA